MYNTTVDSSSRHILTAGVAGALTGKITSVWTYKLDFSGLIRVDKKQHFFNPVFCNNRKRLLQGQEDV